MADLFARFARRCAGLVGSAPAFGLACLLILVWAATGPLLHVSDTWQLVIKAGVQKRREPIGWTQDR